MTHFAAAAGLAAMNPKTAARRMQLAESPSQSTFKEFAAKGARSEAEMADKIVLKAEACIKGADREHQWGEREHESGKAPYHCIVDTLDCLTRKRW